MYMYMCFCVIQDADKICYQLKVCGKSVVRLCMSNCSIIYTCMYIYTMYMHMYKSIHV